MGEHEIWKMKIKTDIFCPHISILCPGGFKFGIWLQILNKEHEKAEDSKPVAVPATAGS